MLDWGTTCARHIAESTGDLGDQDAEGAMVPRLRAARLLMRYATRWVAHQREMDHEDSAALLGGILDQVEIVYGRGFVRPSDELCEALVTRYGGATAAPHQMVAALRDLAGSAVGERAGQVRGP